MKAQYGVAIDQYGNLWYFGKHCRKDLSDQIPGKVSKMYIDSTERRRTNKSDLKTYHIGYIIGGLWLTVFVPAREEIS